MRVLPSRRHRTPAVILIRAGVLLLFAGGTALFGQSYGLYLHAGSLGFGADVGMQIRPDLAVRVGGSYFGLSGDDTLEDGDLDVEGEVRLASFGAFVDYHPGGLIFRFSAGAVYNDIEVSGKAFPTKSYIVGNRVYSVAEMGTLTGSASGTNTIAPYLGIGLGRGVPKKRVGFTVDIGALYLGSTDIEMSGTGAIAPTAEQAGDLEEELKNTSFYPVLTFGLTVRLAG